MIRYIIIINIIIIMIIINHYCHHCHPFFFVEGSNGVEGRGISHWDEALVAIVETQCCWKLGDMAELQPIL